MFVMQHKKIIEKLFGILHLMLHCLLLKAILMLKRGRHKDSPNNKYIFISSKVNERKMYVLFKCMRENLIILI